jgi:sugar lactone lactonase YvrE
MGGTVPIQNATVHLLSVGTTGYGSTPTQLSGTTTLADGTFSFGLFTCSPPNSLVYISAVHGTSTGSGVNSSLLMLAMLGPCNQINNPTAITVNEVTTAASTYAMSQFMGTTEPSQIGSPFAKTVGITNSSLLVKNLVDVNAGTAPGPALPTGATAPSSEINTLANIIAPCVTSLDTGGHASAACEELFCDATPGGVFSGTCNVTPTITDTLGAMFSIARNPASNISTLFNLAVANSPFSPSLGSAPNDWTVGVNYVGGGLSGEPFFIAIDSLGDPWITDFEGSAVTKLSPTGVALTGPSGITGGGMEGPNGIAIDSSNNVWVANSNGTLTELDVNGNILSGTGGFTGGGLAGNYGIAIDPQQNVWVSAGAKLAKICGSVTANCPTNFTTGEPITPSGGFTGGGLTSGLGMATDASSSAWVASSGPTFGSAGAVCKFDLNGNALSGSGGFTAPDLTSPVTYTIIDPAGRAWTTSIGTSSVTELSNGGTLVSSFTGGGISNSESLASDSANNIWVTNDMAPIGSISELNSVGTPISPSTGFRGGGLDDPIGIAIDASGNVWLANENSSSVTQFVGAAAPTKAPLNGPAAAP